MSGMKRDIITIAGTLGSGKSSTAKAIAAALGFRHFSSGDLFRQMARERGVSVEAINLTAETQQEIDYAVDQLLQKMYAEETGIVIDSRMAWHWMPESFKVFLELDPAHAAQRIFNHMQTEGRLSEDARDVDAVRESIDRRFASEQKRYFTLYKVNPTDPHNFDILINTHKNDLTIVTAIVLASFRAWKGAGA